MPGASRARNRSLTVAALAALAALAAAALPAGASAASDLAVSGSVLQVHVTGADSGERVNLLDRRGGRIASKRAGGLGGIVFRRVPAGRGYRIRDGAGELSNPVTVISGKAKPKSTAIYDQTLPAGGYGYLTTRDGTELAISVRLPGPAEDGPYPTVVEYAGYGYARPSGPESGLAQLGNVLGYAVVDVNMRGTGCSGGAFDFFERLQALDGYDVIETVARQPWALHGKAGMFGISYGGISQLFVGATNPPSLSAITPLSVLDNTATTLYPGGILNTGFALEWAKDRVADAQPASATTGQSWAWERIQGGDQVCAQNQQLHTAATDLLAKVRNNRFYRPRTADPLNPSKFVKRIKVPVYLACQWNDEQTGGHCPNLSDRFKGTKRKWFTYTNGFHTDSLDPLTFNRMFDFMEIYMAQRRPQMPALAKAAAGLFYQTALGVPGVSLPPDPIQDLPSYEAAKAAFEKLPRVRVLFDNGGVTPGHPVPSFEQGFEGLPVPGTRARSWFLGPDGSLRGKRPRRAGSDSFVWDKESRPADDFPGTDAGPGDLWTASPSIDWQQPPEGKAASYLSAPLGADTTVIGAGSLWAWIRASVADVDLQVSVTEVRPDGKETYVQSGYLRASMRKLDKRRSTALEPVLTLRRSDAAKLPRGRFSRLVIPLYYQGHVYRAGSRIRITIAPPAGDQPVWSFAETVPLGDADLTVAFSPKRPSRLVLPVVPGVAVPTGLPQCPGLRGEPCRTFTG